MFDSFLLPFNDDILFFLSLPSVFESTSVAFLSSLFSITQYPDPPPKALMGLWLRFQACNLKVRSRWSSPVSGAFFRFQPRDQGFRCWDSPMKHTPVSDYWLWPAKEGPYPVALAVLPSAKDRRPPRTASIAHSCIMNDPGFW